MSLHYFCRHCGHKIGSLSQVSVHSEQVGLHKLSDEDRMEMVSYEQNGDVHIKTICEDCQESLNRNPDYHQSDYLIH